MESNKVFFRGSSHQLLNLLWLMARGPASHPAIGRVDAFAFAACFAAHFLTRRKRPLEDRVAEGMLRRCFLEFVQNVWPPNEFGITFGPTVMGGSQAVEHLLEEHATEFQARWWQGDGSNLFEIVASMNLVNLGESFQPFLADLYITLQYFT